MGIKQKSEQAVTVTLLRPGVEAKNIDLPEGSTLADLLRQENVGTRSSSIAIDGKELAEHLVLRAGMVITVIPQAKSAASERSWRDFMGDFHNDPVFEEIMQAIEEERRAEKEQP